MKNLSDEQLVTAYKLEGNTAYVGELYKRYLVMCFSVAVKYLKDEDAAEDAVMQVFEQLFIVLKTYDIKVVKPWLYTICKNHCLGILKKEAASLFDAMQENNQTDFMENGVEETLSAEEKEKTLEALEAAIMELKPEQQQCIKGFYLHGNTYEQIAVAHGFTLNEVKSHIQNGKRNLKIVLNQQGINWVIIWCIWIINHA